MAIDDWDLQKDDPQLFYGHFIRTDPRTGFQEKQVAQAIDILKPPVKENLLGAEEPKEGAVTARVKALEGTPPLRRQLAEETPIEGRPPRMAGAEEPWKAGDVTGSHCQLQENRPRHLCALHGGVPALNVAVLGRYGDAQRCCRGPQRGDAAPALAARQCRPRRGKRRVQGAELGYRGFVVSEISVT